MLDEDEDMKALLQELHGEKLPFSKLKPGMMLTSTKNRTARYRLLGKHNGSKTLKVMVVGGLVEGKVYDKQDADLFEVLSADPLDQIHPMLAKNVEDYKKVSIEDLLQHSSWWMEEKYDGERQILTFWPHKNGETPDLVKASGEFTDLSLGYTAEPMTMSLRATTRVVGKNTGRLAFNSAKLIHVGEAMVLPTDGVTVFDCEVMHRKGFQVLRSIMGSSDEKALEKMEEHGHPYVVIFDVLWFNGRDLRGVGFKRRREILENWYEEAHAYLKGMGDVEWLDAFGRHIYLSPIARSEDMKRKMLESILAKGGEGAMLKFANAQYTDTTQPGQRSAFLLKVKPFQSDEVVIVGFERGKGEYNQDRIGAIHFAQLVHWEVVEAHPEMRKNTFGDESAKYHFGMGDFTVRVKNELLPEQMQGKYVWVYMGSCSGLTAETEEMFRADPDSFVGQVMEVEFQQRWPETGLLRHPNFMRLRGDKDKHDCIYDPR